ncbi:MAG: hypothetical protein HOQ05_02685 [Corynebacteriales bacterium]|nr:hypothetical protein [Mycobacteriales bacterium]
MSWRVVRHGTAPFPELVRYYEKVQGWNVIRVAERHEVKSYALARRAEPQPELDGGIALKN